MCAAAVSCRLAFALDGVPEEEPLHVELHGKQFLGQVCCKTLDAVLLSGLQMHYSSSSYWQSSLLKSQGLAPSPLLSNSICQRNPALLRKVLEQQRLTQPLLLHTAGGHDAGQGHRDCQ